LKTKVIKLHPEFPDIESILRCANVVREGGLVIFPTETVYGIAADNSNPKAIQRLQEVKHRSSNKPFSILISQSELISNYTRSNRPFLYKLIDRYWPGPLTIVVESKDSLKTVGVRVPDNIIARKLMSEIPGPVAAPSANIEGRPAPRTLEEALVDLDGLIDIAIDGGPATYGEGSSVVDITQEKPVVLREGVIPAAEIEALARRKTILFVCTGNSCRSVMAHYLLQNMVKHRDDLEVCSAGTSVFIQAKASAETISVLQEKGINAHSHLSQPINTILLKKADLIFVMTRGHRQQVLERVPEVEKKIYLLKEFAAGPDSLMSDLDIPDPIGRDRTEYKLCLRVIEEAVTKVVGLL